MKTNLLQLENFCTPAMILNSHPIFDVPEVICGIISHIASVPDYVHFTRTFSKLFPFLNAETAYKIYHIDKPYMRIPEPRQPFHPLNYLATIRKHYAPEPPVGPLWLRKDMIMMQIQDMVKAEKQSDICLSLFLGDHFWSIAEYIMDNVVGFHLDTESVFKHGLATMSEARIRLIIDRKFGTPYGGLFEAVCQDDTAKVQLFISLYPNTINMAVSHISLFYPWHEKRQLFDLLLDAGADPSLGLKDAACKVEVLEYLLQKVQLRFPGRPIPPKLLSPALETACNTLNEESVRLLLKIGALPTSMKHLNAALSWPERVNLTIIDLLLSHNVGRIDSFILGKSMCTRQAVVVKKLLDYGAEVDVSTMSACCCAGSAEIMKLMAPLIKEHKSFSEKLRLIGFWKLFSYFDCYGIRNIEAMIEVEAFKVFVEEMGSHGLRDLILDNCRRYPIQARHPALYTYLMEELLPKTS